MPYLHSTVKAKQGSKKAIEASRNGNHQQKAWGRKVTHFTDFQFNVFNIRDDSQSIDYFVMTVQKI